MQAIAPTRNLNSSHMKGNAMSITQRCLAGLLSAVLAVSTVGCAHDTAMSQKVDDSVITTKVKTALLADPDVSGTAISVETVAGEVHLSGFVDSPEQVTRAVDIASRVDGVGQVVNKMTLSPK
jgi:osmotically-inducible protein OsmY